MLEVILSILKIPILPEFISLTICFELLNGAPPIAYELFNLIVSTDLMVKLPVFNVSVPPIICDLLVLIAALHTTFPVLLFVLNENGLVVDPLNS